MKKLTVYGLPLNPTHLLEQLKGASFCVSFATRVKLGQQLDQAIELVGEDQILLVDNGAFSYFKQGKSTRDESYLDEFEAWALDILERCPQAVAVVPDVIGGTEQDNADLMLLSQLPTERSMVVWHLHESLDHLRYLLESGYEWLGFGSSGEYWQVGTEKWHARIREAFATIEAWERELNDVRPRLHLLRAQAEAHGYDFDSSDSVNVAMNHGRYRKQGDGHVGRFAARVSGKIQASCDGTDAEHQAKRPLLFHLEFTEWRAQFILDMYLDRLNRQLAEPAQQEDAA